DTFVVGSAEANLYAQGGFMSVIDPTTAKPTFSIYSRNYNSAQVRLYAVQPSDFYQFQQYVRRLNYDDDTQRPTIPGRLVFDKVVPIKSVSDDLVETSIDISSALERGSAIVIPALMPSGRR